ncbi:FIST signal transduction protein [methane-oxidizing endosymbiont of Gigantopelta aegis]|uniref:FIST signal transduction protein n=1 Tax=methane-oxidizing endosymbiont of Gigantopelta aegis TaxID=2794938 RepID=UPI0018DB53DE|nr:FIST N-terminal domain-containing protein [methane-oxidizing endosymbiont of Gigantopelta aegis]
MEHFLNISCQYDDAQAVIMDCLKQLEAIPDEYNFGFIYVTDAMADAYPDLLKQCKNKTGIEHWLGTIGVGIIATGQELYDRPAVSILLANFDLNELSMLPLIKDVKDMALFNKTDHFLTHFGIIHGDPFYQQTQNLIQDIQQQVQDCFLVGGLTSSSDKQYQVSDEVFTGGVSGVFFSENIPVLSNLSQGCRPIAVKRTITRAKDNVLYTLDNQPALDVLMQDCGIAHIDALKDRANEIFTGLCVNGSDQSDYIVRNLVGVDVGKKLFAINDKLIEGHEMIFCERNEQTAIDDMQDMLDKIASRLKQKPKGGIYVSCLGRGREQFGKDSEEIKMIHDTLGDFPLTGFFANGEIHHNKLYGYTGVLTLFV